VKLASIPLAVESERSRFPETFTLFQLALGKVFEIRSFGEYGHAELWLHPDGSPADTAAADSIWVEPEHLQLSSVYDIAEPAAPANAGRASGSQSNALGPAWLCCSFA
jgi:hypothetical protein